jgi:hypothetical protein
MIVFIYKWLKKDRFLTSTPSSISSSSDASSALVSESGSAWRVAMRFITAEVFATDV